MKLVTKVIILLLCIFYVTSSLRKKVPIKNTDNHESFRKTFPLSRITPLPLTRVYRSIHSVFPNQRKPYRAVPNSVKIGTRNCKSVCSDRMTIGCKKVKARANQYGVLECICVQKNRANTKVYPQGDICYSKSGCIVRNQDEECPFNY